MTEDTKNQAYAVNQNAETRVFTRKDRHRRSRHFGHKMASLFYDESKLQVASTSSCARAVIPRNPGLLGRGYIFRKKLIFVGLSLIQSL